MPPYELLAMISTDAAKPFACGCDVADGNSARHLRHHNGDDRNRYSPKWVTWPTSSRLPSCARDRRHTRSSPC